MIWRRLILGVVGVVLTAATLAAQALPKPMVVVLVGPPASGKSTQAEYLNKKYKLPFVSIEHLLEKKMGRGAEGADLHRGDADLDGLLKEHLENMEVSGGFTLDGYPATRKQADYLTKLAREMNLPSPIVVQIHIPDHVAHDRSKSRAGTDDKPEIIARRLQQYHKEMDMLRAYYPEADIWTIDGSRDTRGVSATLRLLIEDRMEE
jgi:adenylate kinase